MELDSSFKMPPLIVDFKHYFSVNSESLREDVRAHYVCSIEVLFRERLSQRFANYLARIGLPDLGDDKIETPNRGI